MNTIHMNVHKSNLVNSNSTNTKNEIIWDSNRGKLIESKDGIVIKSYDM